MIYLNEELIMFNHVLAVEHKVESSDNLAERFEI